MTGSRRALLGCALTGLTGALVGCPSAQPVTPVERPEPKEPPDREVARLETLLTAVRLEWLVLLQPQRLVETSWLAPSLSRILRDDRLDLLAQSTGVDLRRVSELALAGYAASKPGDEAIAYFVRHRSSSIDLERKFRARLTSDEERSVAGHQLVRVWGKIGTGPRGFSSVGPDVVGYQYGGSKRSGPTRIALLYAQGRLDDIPTVLEDRALRPLLAAFDGKPARVLLPGPFEGPMARGARGLLAAATGLGAALEPTPSQHLAFEVRIVGSYPEGPEASEFLRLAWKDLATSDLGHLLGLHAPAAPPVVQQLPDGLSLRTELDAKALFDGLAAATVDDIREIMK